MKYEVRETKISKEVDSKGKKKGIIPGRLIGTIEVKDMVAPGSTIKVKGRNRRVRCVDCFNNIRIILVEK